MNTDPYVMFRQTMMATLVSCLHNTETRMGPTYIQVLLKCFVNHKKTSIALQTVYL
jgi:hypothetical protein